VASATLVTEVPAPVTARRETSDSLSDEALVAAVRTGEDRAFELLYARYQRRIAAYVFGMVKDHGRAEDVTQEVFMSALRRMRQTDRSIVFKPWIYEIAKNACIDQFRRSRRAEEVSFDLGEELGAGDQGRLVASDPTPDAAVDTKQQLDHLCGAFGGLSDSHHEILVLRELEGLSYREIGDRMGLSRPGVESTLFRARRRLTEEYDELVSGQRCVRIQSIIAEASGSMPGTRDSRRLARHVAHCQPCRRQAVLAGIDAAVVAHRPARRSIAEKVAGLLPFPAFLRGRGFGSSEMAGPMSEPTAAAWSKAAAIAASLVIASVGAGPGAGVGVGSDKPPAAPAADQRATPAATQPASAAPALAPVSRAPAATRAGRDRPAKASSEASSRVQRRSTRAGGAPAPARSMAPRRAARQPGTAPGSTSSPAVSAPTVAAPADDSVARRPAAGSKPDTGSSPSVPSVSIPQSVPSLPDVVRAAPGTVGDTAEAVEDTASAVVQQAEDVVSGATQSLPGNLGG